MSKSNRILVVDNEVPLLRYTAMILERKGGYEVVIAKSGNAAWKYLTTNGLTEEGEIGLVFADHDMPDGNGSELVRRIKSDARFEGLPVLMASGRPENADTPKIDGFIDKPYSVNTLVEAVQKYLP